MEVPAIWKQTQSDLDRPEDLNKMLIGLAQAGKIQWVNRTRSGAQGYMIIRAKLNTKSVYVDYSLLKEYENGTSGIVRVA